MHKKTHLNEGHSHSVHLDVTLDGVTDSGHKLVRDDKDEDICTLDCIQQLWNCNLKS